MKGLARSMNMDSSEGEKTGGTWSIGISEKSSSILLKTQLQGGLYYLLFDFFHFLFLPYYRPPVCIVILQKRLRQTPKPESGLFILLVTSLSNISLFSCNIVIYSLFIHQKILRQFVDSQCHIMQYGGQDSLMIVDQPFYWRKIIVGGELIKN